MATSTSAPPRARVGAGPRAGPRGAVALAGVLAVGAALAITELLAGLIPAVPSLVHSIGAAVVDLSPGWLERFAIGLFGTKDKPALLVGIVVVALAVGGLAGVLAARRFAYGAAVFVAFGVLAVVATTADPLASIGAAAFSATVGVGMGLVVLRWLLGRVASLPLRVPEADVAEVVAFHATMVADHPAGTEDAAPEEAPTVAGPGNTRRVKLTAEGRRDFLRLAAGVGAAAVVVGAAGTLLDRRSGTAAVRADVRLPQSAEPLGAPAPGQQLHAQGLSPLFTPNADFYRIDTALMVPRLDSTTWSMGITGMVDRPLTLNFDDLLAEELVEADVTIACVSNEVGGHLIGNARWLGVPLARLLERAGVQEGATQIVGVSVDGFTAGFPTELALDGRNALLAIGMNGEPLPVEHGYPARLIIPGIYGYVSATKWLQEIRLTTWEGFDGYWVPRGWSKEGPIKTSSRIDVPSARGAVAAGRVAVAGVAWAQQRGVARVEVRIDDGPWQEAQLADELNIDTWRQWLYEWDASPGQHRIAVRATDGDGNVQLEERTPPAPDGAQGYHLISLTVR